MSNIKRITLNTGEDFLDWRQGSGNTIEIYDIVVNSSRRKGVGRALVSTLLASLPEETVVWAITRTENRIAQEFYHGLRFHVIGVLYEFYDSACGKVDAVMYGRKAGGPV